MKNIVNKNSESSLVHYTYNPIKRDFLKSKGISYILKGTHRITEKPFWIYLKCSELDQVLKDWRKYQEEKFNKKQ